MEFIIQFIVALFATLSFAVIFSAPKKELFYCGFTGALGWIIYYIMVQFDMGVVFPSLIATLCLTIMARIFAAARSMPVTVYLLSGIFPLVPGAGIFYTAYYLFTNDRALSSSKGIETFEVAGAIVLGIIFLSLIHISTCEINKLTLKNTSDKKKDFSVFSYVEFCLWNAMDDMTNFQRNFSTGEVEIHAGGSQLFHKTEYRERRNHYAVYLSLIHIYAGLQSP